MQSDRSSKLSATGACPVRGKHPHKSYDEAKKHLEHLRKGNRRARGSKIPTGNASPKDLRVYQCRHCGFWHVGHWRREPK